MILSDVDFDKLIDEWNKRLRYIEIVNFNNRGLYVKRKFESNILSSASETAELHKAFHQIANGLITYLKINNIIVEVTYGMASESIIKRYHDLDFLLHLTPESLETYKSIIKQQVENFRNESGEENIQGKQFQLIK